MLQGSLTKSRQRTPPQFSCACKMEYGATNNSDFPVMDTDSGTPEDTLDIAGLWDSPTLRIRDTWFGKFRPWRDTKCHERVFWVACGIVLLTSLVYSCYRMATLPPKSPDFALALVLLVNTVFSSIYIVRGVLQMRTWDIFIFALATFLVWLHILIHFILGDKTASELARLIVSSIGGLTCIILAVKLASRYGTGIEYVFKAVKSANTHKQTLYSRLLLFTEFLTFNVQLSFNLLILSVTSRLNFLEPDTEEIVDIVLWLIFTLAFFLWGYFSMLRESCCGARIFFGISPLELGFIIYRIVRVSMTETGYKDRYLEVCTYVCGSLTAFFLGMIVLLAWFMYSDFGGAGLRDILSRENTESDRQGQLDENRPSTSANRN